MHSMSIWHIYNKKSFTSKTEPQSSKIGWICRRSQGLLHLQPCTTHNHSGEIWLPTKTMLINHTHVQKKIVKIVIGKIDTYIDFKLGVKQGYSMALVLFLFLMMSFAKNLEDEWAALGLIKDLFVRKDNSEWSTGKLVSHQPGTFTSDTLFDRFCMLYLDEERICFWIQDWHLKKGSSSSPTASLNLASKCTLEQKKISQRLNASSSCLQSSSTHALRRSLNPLTPPWPSRRKKARKIDAHVRTNNIPSTNKHRSSKWKEDSSSSPSTSITWKVKYRSLSEMITTSRHA